MNSERITLLGTGATLLTAIIAGVLLIRSDVHRLDERLSARLDTLDSRLGSVDRRVAHMEGALGVSSPFFADDARIRGSMSAPEAEEQPG